MLTFPVTLSVCPGPMLSAWLKPPIKPLMKLYVFNITNPQEVLEGLDPQTEELGPYVYRSSLERQITTVTHHVYKEFSPILRPCLLSIISASEHFM